MSADSRKKAKQLAQMIDAADSIAIIGHIHPDGDCMGSNLAMYNYIIDNYKGKTVDVYDGSFSTTFKIMSGYRRVKHEPTDKRYDLAIALDVSDEERLGKFQDIFNSAISTAIVDHHISNKGFGDLCYIVPTASSACEALCDLIDLDKVSQKTATCLYLGIVHDSGVFKYPNTSRNTMEVAGLLLDKGVDAISVIDDTFYKKTYKQNRLMGQVIVNSQLYAEGKIVSGQITRELFKEFKCTTMDTEGIVEQLRLTDGVEVAILGYQKTKKQYKFSLRSKTVVDVSKVALMFGGGGHVRAAGFETTEDYDKVFAELIEILTKEINEAK